MRTVKDILAEKGGHVVTVQQDHTVAAVIALLVEKGIGAVVVLGDGGSIAGIFSERDYVRIADQRKGAVSTVVMSEVMTSQVLCVHPEQSVDECMSLVTEKRCRHLPVLSDGDLCGLVSIGDLVKSALSEKEFLIQQLTHYIKS